MTILIVQTCNKCKKERTLPYGLTSGGQVSASHEQGGWRPFNGDKHVCPQCLNEFVGGLK